MAKLGETIRKFLEEASSFGRMDLADAYLRMRPPSKVIETVKTHVPYSKVPSFGVGQTPEWLETRRWIQERLGIPDEKVNTQAGWAGTPEKGRMTVGTTEPNASIRPVGGKPKTVGRAKLRAGELVQTLHEGGHDKALEVGEAAQEFGNNLNEVYRTNPVKFAKTIKEVRPDVVNNIERQLNTQSKFVKGWWDAYRQATKMDPALLREAQAQGWGYRIGTMPKEAGGLDIDPEKIVGKNFDVNSLVTYSMGHMIRFPESPLAKFMLNNFGQDFLSKSIVRYGETPAVARQTVERMLEASNYHVPKAGRLTRQYLPNAPEVDVFKADQKLMDRATAARVAERRAAVGKIPGQADRLMTPQNISKTSMMAKTDPFWSIVGPALTAAGAGWLVPKEASAQEKEGEFQLTDAGDLQQTTPEGGVVNWKSVKEQELPLVAPGEEFDFMNEVARQTRKPLLPGTKVDLASGEVTQPSVPHPAGEAIPAPEVPTGPRPDLGYLTESQLALAQGAKDAKAAVKGIVDMMSRPGEANAQQLVDVGKNALGGYANITQPVFGPATNVAKGAVTGFGELTSGNAPTKAKEIFKRVGDIGSPPSTGNEALDTAIEVAVGLLPLDTAAFGLLKLRSINKARELAGMAKYAEDVKMLPEAEMWLKTQAGRARTGLRDARNRPINIPEEAQATGELPFDIDVTQLGRKPRQLERGSIPLGGATEPAPRISVEPAAGIPAEGTPGIYRQGYPGQPPPVDPMGMNVQYLSEPQQAWMARPAESETIPGAVRGGGESMPDVPLTPDEAHGFTAAAMSRQDIEQQLAEALGEVPGKPAGKVTSSAVTSPESVKDAAKQMGLPIQEEMNVVPTPKATRVEMKPVWRFNAAEHKKGMELAMEPERVAADLRDVTHQPGVMKMDPARARGERQRLMGILEESSRQKDPKLRLTDRDRAAVEEQVKQIDDLYGSPDGTHAQDYEPIQQAAIPGRAYMATMWLVKPVDEMVEKFAPQISRTIRRAFHDGEAFEHEMIQRKDAILKGFGEGDRETLSLVMHGKMQVPAGSKIDVAAKQMRALLDEIKSYTEIPEIRKYLGDTGYLENYFPGMKKEDFLPFHNVKSDKELMDEAMALTERAVAELPADLIHDPKARGYKTMFLKKRAGEVVDPVLDADRVMNAYIAGMRKSLFDLPAAARAKAMASMVPRAVQKGGKVSKTDANELANAFIDFYMGAPSLRRKPGSAKELEIWLGNRIYGSLLGGNIGTSARNLTQLLNTMAYAGVTPTLKSIFKTFTSKKGWQEYKKTGAMLEYPGLEHGAWARKSKLEEGITGAVMTPFSASEKVNRVATYNTAMEQGAAKEQAFKKLIWDYRQAMAKGDMNAARALTKKMDAMRPEVLSNAKQTEGFGRFQTTPREMAAHDLVRKTQFTYGRSSPFAETVYGSNAPGMHLATQMLSFARRQTNVGQTLAANALKNGDWAPLARWTALWLGAVGLGAERATMFMPGKSPAVQVWSDFNDVTQGRKDPYKFIADVAFLLVPAGLQIKKFVMPPKENWKSSNPNKFQKGQEWKGTSVDKFK